jgi:hypothetical protein
MMSPISLSYSTAAALSQGFERRLVARQGNAPCSAD